VISCPNCQRTLAPTDAQCPGCGLVIGAEAASKGVATWVWVIIGAGVLLGAVTCGCVGLYLFAVGGHTVIPVTRSTTSSSTSSTTGASGTDEIETALNGWSETHDGKLPERLEDLLGPNGHDETWFASGTLPTDRFGHEYDYRPNNETNGWTYEVWSLGRDGAAGGTGEDEDVRVLAASEKRD
jgi:hypothetical protein